MLLGKQILIRKSLLTEGVSVNLVTDVVMILGTVAAPAIETARKEIRSCSFENIVDMERAANICWEVYWLWTISCARCTFYTQTTRPSRVRSANGDHMALNKNQTNAGFLRQKVSREDGRADTTGMS